MSKNDPTPDPDRRFNTDDLPKMLLHTSWCVWCYPDTKEYASFVVNGESICVPCMDGLIKAQEEAQ